MPESPYRYLISRMEQGALVLRILAPHLRGEEMIDEVRHELLTAIEPDCRKVVLDLQNVESLTSAGLRPLLALWRKLQERNGRVVLCHLSPVVSEVLQTTRLVTTSGSSTAPLEVRPDVTAALAVLNKADG